MTRRRVTRPLVAGATFLVALALVQVVGAAPRDTKSMVLRLRDLPPRFALESSGYRTNATLQREEKAEPRKDYRALGRISGYAASFEKHGLVGLAHVDSTASTYKTTRGAQRSWSQSVAQVKNGASGFRFTRLSVGGLGTRAALFKATTTSSGVSFDVYVLYWRYRAVFASVTGGGISGGVRRATIVDLARKQQRRIQRVVG